MPLPVRDAQAMIAGMAPVLDLETWVFCTTTDATLAARLAPVATIREAEGVTLVLSGTEAEAAGFGITSPMRRITLTVHSALDGVGLTAAVATALANAGIPCNMIAGYHHDHVFVPAAMAGPAMTVLHELQRNAR